MCSYKKLMFKRGKLKYLLNVIVLTLLINCNIFADSAQKLSEISSINFKVSSKIITLAKLSDFNVTDLVTNKNTVLMTDHRKIYVLKKGRNKLQKLDISSEPKESAWFSPICTNTKDFIIHIANYPNVQQDEDASKYRGDFIAAPSSQGFVTIDKNLKNQRHIQSLKIVSRPPTQIGDYNKTVGFSDLVQSCTFYGNKVFLGSYGLLGKADFKKETIELIEEDEEMTFNRYPIFVEKEFIWIEIDEGGMGGASVEKWSHQNTKVGGFYIDNGDDVISYTAFIRHKGQMIVGTTHGLFSLDEKTGRFTRFDLGKEISSMPTENLLQHDGYLWGFINGEWFRIDTKKRLAIKQVDSNKNKFTNGVFFDGAWILIGSSGIWKKKK